MLYDTITTYTKVTNIYAIGGLSALEMRAEKRKARCKRDQNINTTNVEAAKAKTSAMIQQLEQIKHHN